MSLRKILTTHYQNTMRVRRLTIWTEITQSYKFCIHFIFVLTQTHWHFLTNHSLSLLCILLAKLSLNFFSLQVLFTQPPAWKQEVLDAHAQNQLCSQALGRLGTGLARSKSVQFRYKHSQLPSQLEVGTVVFLDAAGGVVHCLAIPAQIEDVHTKFEGVDGCSDRKIVILWQKSFCSSLCVCVCDGVVKWLKHLTVNRKITGSSPTSYHWRKKNKNIFLQLRPSVFDLHVQFHPFSGKFN